jgi:molybdopterin-guanine dinucleotide biosynthesis protein A
LVEVGAMSAAATVFGVIIAGGRSTRMGGGHKALLQLRGQRLVDHVRARLSPQCAGLALSVNDTAAFKGVGLPLLEDDPALELAGPLAGILAGLDHVAAQQITEWVVSAPADAPFLPADLVARLIAARVAEQAEIACAASGGRVHPVIALWPVRIRGELREALLRDGVRRVDRFTARYRLAVVEWPTAPRDPFFNINVPSDLAMAEAIADD